MAAVVGVSGRPDFPRPRGSPAVFEQVFEIFDESDFTPQEIVDLGDRVVVVHRFVGRGQGSRIPVEVTETSVWTLREGKAIRQEAFATKAEALEAVGLAEQDAHADS